MEQKYPWTWSMGTCTRSRNFLPSESLRLGSSYNIQIGRANALISPQDVVRKTNPSSPGPTLPQNPKSRSPAQHLTMASYLMSVYRLGQIDRSVIGVYYPNPRKENSRYDKCRSLQELRNQSHHIKLGSQIRQLVKQHSFFQTCGGI